MIPKANTQKESHHKELRQKMVPFLVFRFVYRSLGPLERSRAEHLKLPIGMKRQSKIALYHTSAVYAGYD